MLTVFHSNRQEVLIAQLAELTRHGRPTPLSAETIITQSPGMARWVAIQLAEYLGIAANFHFPLPSSFFWNLFGSQFPELGTTSGYEKPVLTWRIMKLLPGLITQPAFVPLQRYLQDDDERRYYQLSRRIADVLDQYLIYRPQMVLGWNSLQADEDWQAILWRDLVKDTGHSPHRAQLLQGFLDNCRGGKLDATHLPPRLNLFGIPSLPPAYLELLHCLAQYTEVNLFMLNPCQYYWGDIEDPKRTARRRSKLILQNQTDEDYRIHGNRLLASMGKQGRDFIDALLHYDPIEQEFFHDVAPDTLLGHLQQDILELDEPQRGEHEADGSIGLHICHSPMREVEILHDQLLELFNRDPQLQPEEVIIMTPDVEAYAPYIEAVFGAATGTQQLPWTLSDRTLQGQHPVVRAFQQLLDVCTSRFEASKVLSLLEQASILKRFQLNEAQFEQIRLWVHDSGIRWGLDQSDHASLGMAAEQHSWGHGLRRLLVGYSLPAEVELYGEIAPYPHIEGQAVLALGQLLQFIEQLQWLHAQLQQAHHAEGWNSLLKQALEQFFPEDDETENALQWIRTALADLMEEQQAAGYEQTLGLEILREHLNSSFNESLSDTRFLNGKLTICTLLPMRSLPFKVVMMIGMNEGSFPRQNRPLGFDLIAQAPQRGDRSRREDDRYLFLEAMLSARQSVYVSYVGRDIRDNSPRLPSVLVTELLDYVEHCYGKQTRRAICIEHPMQAFSPHNFLPTRGLFSYADDWLPGLHALNQPLDDNGCFADAPLPRQQEGEWELDLDALIRFFGHPARAFLQQRLGIQFPYRQDLTQDEEPFALDSLQGYQLKQTLLPYLLEDKLDYGLQLMQARGALPAAAFGELNRQALEDELQWMQEKLPELLQDKHTDLEIDLHITGVHLTGWLRNRYAAGMVNYRPGNIRPQDQLGLWLQHLAHHCQAGPIDSHYLGRHEQLQLQAVKNAEAQLAELLQLYQQGMQQALHFYPRTSWAYVQKEGSEYDVWKGHERSKITPESQDEYYELALRGQDPLDEAFRQLAQKIYSPLLKALYSNEVEDA